MIEIRTFDGEPGELAAFCTASLRKRYAGRVPMILWSREFFQWDLFAGGSAGRDFLVAAYDGTRLVGMLPAKPVQYRLRGQSVAGTLGCCFAVDPEYEGRGVSLKLNLEQRRRHRERGAQIQMGFVDVASAGALGKEFWLRLRTVQVVSRLGMWARIIDHRAVSDYEFSCRDRCAARLLGCFQRAPRPPRHAHGIRTYRPEDLPDCLRLAERRAASVEFGYEWTAEALGRHLAPSEVSRTLVADAGGRVVGFLNYCRLNVLGRRTITVAFIDEFVLEDQSATFRTDLLQVALDQIAHDGCHVALLLRLSGLPTGTLLAAGFVPQPAGYRYIAQSLAPGLLETPVRTVHAHFR